MNKSIPCMLYLRVNAIFFIFPSDPCAAVSCLTGHTCEVHTPTGEAFCMPSCSLNNGGCPLTHQCSLKAVACVSAPCPPVVECTPPRKYLYWNNTITE